MATKAKVALAKSLNTLVTKQDAFSKAVDSLKEFSRESIEELVREIDAKKEELNEIEKSISVKEKDGKINLEQRLKQYGYEEALKIIQDNGQTVIEDEQYQKTLTENNNLKTNWEQEIQKVRDEERARQKKEIVAVTNNLNLKHEAITAKITAETEQQAKEILSLTKSIESLRAEIAAQRELTKEVAMAGKQGAITQSFGK